MFNPRIVALVFACTAFASPLVTAAQSTGLEDLVGARAGQAESELQRRGYRNVRGEKGDDRSYTYWWNGERRQCVSIATMNGRYDSITLTTSPDCRVPADDDWRPSPASGRGADRRDQSDRGFDDARHARHHMPVRGMSDLAELQAICRAEASGRYDRRPSDLTVNAPIRQPTGAIVQGWFDVDKRTTFFNCRFDEDGRFIAVF